MPTQFFRRVLPPQRLTTTRALFVSNLRTSSVSSQVRSLSSSNVVITKTKPTDEPPTMNMNHTASTQMDEKPAPSTTTNTKGQVVQITASCWNRIHKLVTSKNNPNLYLRVFVDAGGCSGFSYQFELDDAALEPDDVLFESGGNRLVIDEASLEMLQGSTIDYVQEMIKSSFQVMDNPQSESACGCGSSFALKNFSANPALD